MGFFSSIRKIFSNEPPAETPTDASEPEQQAPEAQPASASGEEGAEAAPPEAETDPEPEALEAISSPAPETSEETSAPEPEAPDESSAPKPEAAETISVPEPEALETISSPEQEEPEEASVPKPEAPEAAFEPELSAPPLTPAPAPLSPAPVQDAPTPEAMAGTALTPADLAGQEDILPAPEADVLPQVEKTDVALPQAEATQETPVQEEPALAPETKALPQEAAPSPLPAEAPEPVAVAPDVTPHVQEIKETALPSQDPEHGAAPAEAVLPHSEASSTPAVEDELLAQKTEAEAEEAEAASLALQVPSCTPAAMHDAPQQEKEEEPEEEKPAAKPESAPSGLFSSIRRFFSAPRIEETPEAGQDAETEKQVSESEQLTDTDQSPEAMPEGEASAEDLVEEVAAPAPRATAAEDQRNRGVYTPAGAPQAEPEQFSTPDPVQDSPTLAVQDPQQVAMTLALRQAEPRLSAWLAIILEGVNKADALLWERVAFLLASLEAPHDEIEAFIKKFRLWLEDMEYENLEDFRSELQYRLALALDLEDEEDERSRLMIKLSEGLTKTREHIARNLNTLFLSGRAIDEAFWEELEEILIMADVGFETAHGFTERLRRRAQTEGITDAAALRDAMRREMLEVFKPARRISVVNPPEVILVIGVNGVGKTTTIAKLCHRAVLQGKKVLLVAGDTFRAAATEQLEIWAKRAGAGFYAKGHGADPAAVAYEAIDIALAEGYDTVFVDTAGRLHTKTNLMEELVKIRRVLGKRHPGAPHRTLLVLDATTGQNGVSQVKLFHQACGIDELILTKLDGTAKGGIAVTVAMQYNLPISFIGLGEKMGDLRPFDAQGYVTALLGLDTEEA